MTDSLFSTAVPVLNISAAESTQPLRILQITDCHLGEKSGERLVGMDTDESLDYVLQKIHDEDAGSRLLLATGDLANHGSLNAYKRLADKLDRLQMPCAWLPGNHDVLELMVEAVGADTMPRLINIGNWTIVLLNSAVPGKVGGELGDAELAFVAEALKNIPSTQHIIFSLHHQPIPIGSAWLDTQKVIDGDTFIELLQGDKRVRAIIWGHVHQAFEHHDERLPGVKLMSTPSTCVQFSPQSDDFCVGEQQPAYRWFDLHTDGQLETGISRLEGINLQVDENSKGY